MHHINTFYYLGTDFDNNEITTPNVDYCEGDINTIPLHSSTMYDIVELGLSPTRSLEDDIMNNQSKYYTYS